MRDVQRIAIVDPNDTTRDELRSALLGMESIWLEAECSRYEFFLDVIQQSSPDVVIVSLDSDQNKALQLISQLSGAAPELPILAISASGDGQAILQALRSGAREFLTAPLVIEELLTALQRMSRQRAVANGESHHGNGSAAKMESSVIAILGSRGGVGCTSIAVNLAASLAQNKSNNVALIDLDMALGDADIALDLTADYTLADVAMNIDRLDMNFLRRSLSKHACGLSLLPHPVQMEDSHLIREEHLQRVISLLRASYTHLILDLSKAFSPTDVMALRMANVVLLIAELELSSLRNVVRMLLSLGNDETLTNKVHVVLNRVGSECGGDISVKKAEETIGKQIFWQIPNESKTLMDARNQGVPLVSYAPKSKLNQSLVGLAAQLSGNNEAPATPTPSRWKIFSRK